jgi:hypothetical protein
MALTYTYEVTGLKVRDETINGVTNTNAVVQTYWRLTGTDENGNEGTFSGATPFTSTTMPEGDTFVAFEDLKEEMVIDWISDVVNNNASYKQHIDGQIMKQINDKITPITEPTLPWKPVANTADPVSSNTSDAPESMVPPPPGE